ncbi:hypothetical protein B0H17DRAFT_1194059 [Mycena rosella]|uniref:DUF6534 domain-containing protein n=1 Tax=Mycena rosella TaxID=1033263 RepID=A0AAD7E235_MYCRO|nr:hypothetical protein B0H17DRAFT_1194059 [Mycena rosella]
MVRNFSAYRIYRLSTGNWILAGLVTLPSLAVFGSSLYYAAVALGYQDITELEHLKNIALEIAVLGADELLIVCHRSEVYKIIFTLSSGIPTSFASIASATSLAVSPDTFVYFFWFTLLGGLYTNSMLVTLNSREYIRSRGSDEPIQMQSRLRFRSGTDVIARTPSGLPNHNPITIRIDKQTESDLQLVRRSTENLASGEV